MAAEDLKRLDQTVKKLTVDVSMAAEDLKRLDQMVKKLTVDVSKVQADIGEVKALILERLPQNPPQNVQQEQPQQQERQPQAQAQALQPLTESVFVWVKAVVAAASSAMCGVWSEVVPQQPASHDQADFSYRSSGSLTVDTGSLRRRHPLAPPML
ncbi:hypothetical protein HYH03_013873 [Edaphochlamys debaryana]|uniref:Uncharacterized protein n=1 Tax=Edaphochlamys debaryana TaxID=47281 RepID=A0A835XXN5_9CHLO|nr:hypothetical protein HYH03_013873 [Edaphochlamys debaryana]|eukprot:KAG2487594.1 hypothetical protein HYH03_013873 [Edaphochlamys debaryana]